MNPHMSVMQCQVFIFDKCLCYVCYKNTTQIEVSSYHKLVVMYSYACIIKLRHDVPTLSSLKYMSTHAVGDSIQEQHHTY